MFDKQQVPLSLVVLMLIRNFMLIVLSLLMHVGCSNGVDGDTDSNGDIQPPLVVAFISHTYFVNQHSDIQDIIVEQINTAKPKYIFALGDVVLRNTNAFWGPTLEFFSRFDAKVYFSPGNHDIYDYNIVEGLATNRHYPQWRQDYIDRIGYIHKHIKDPKADFISINSNDPFFLLQPFLDKALSEASPQTPTVLLTHHHVWKNRYQANWVNWPLKHSRKEEMLPYIARFDQVVAGDLHGHLETIKLGDTSIAMVGIGNRDKLPFWVLATLASDGNFSFEQKTIELPYEHSYHYRAK